MAARKRVSWKAGTEPVSKLKYPFYVREDAFFEGQNKDNFAGAFCIGGLFTTKFNLSPVSLVGYVQPMHPYLNESWDDIKIPKGTVAIYAGMTRADEMLNNSVVSVPRRTFIIMGKKYLISNISLISPVI